MFQIATIFKKMEQLLLGVVFAEANLKEVALLFLKEKRKKRCLKKVRDKNEERPSLRL